MAGNFAIRGRRAIRGHPVAVSFEAVVDETLGKIYGSMYYHVRDRELAMDLTQETFLQAATSWDTFKPGRKPLPWLMTIASRVRARHFEAVRKQRDTELRMQLEVSVAQPTELEIQGVPDAFKLLSQDDQTVLYHAVILDQKVSDVARDLGIRRSACSMRIQRALQQLRDLMGDDLDA